MWELLQAIETKLKTIATLDTVKIGIEKGISAKDTPAARIVLDTRESEKQRRYLDDAEIQIVVLLDLKNDLSSLYEQSISIENSIREVLNGTVLYTRTEYDRDSVSVFKALIMSFSARGIANNIEGCK